MAGRGPAPKHQRYRRATPGRGEWQPSDEGGWQHAEPPPAPGGISPAAGAVWTAWFGSWWAANWTPDDLPGLRLVIRLWDRVNRGDIKRAGELRQWLDSYGITPKGQQDRRWTKPMPPREGWSALERIRLERAQRLGDGQRPSARERLKAIHAEYPQRFDKSRFDGTGDP